MGEYFIHVHIHFLLALKVYNFVGLFVLWNDTQQRAGQVESNPGLLREDIASVYGVPVLPTEPLGAPEIAILTLFCPSNLSRESLLFAPDCVC